MRLAQIRKVIISVVAVIVVYGLAWLFGDHQTTYAVLPATLTFANEWTCPEGHADGNKCDVQPTKQLVDKWVCNEGDVGPFPGENLTPYECHAPETTCPLLWFPIAAESPCSYRDPLEHH